MCDSTMCVNESLFPKISLTLLYTLTIAYPTEVYTSSGTVEGEIACHDGIHVKVYLGIPYAKPPIGDLRFKKTMPVELWNTTLKAKQFPPGCVQHSENPFPWLDDLPGLSEDCLYLNIWAPIGANALNKKSIMFWIHGGGFRISSSRLDFYNGEALAAEGDVVVVTTNYRLGAEGFFDSGTEDAPGNMGMWDIVEALKWVRNNIGSFGGDKDSITLFGQSAGGIAIGMFCVSPVTRGLFKRVILQSGSPANLEGEDNDTSFKISQKLAEAAGCATHGDTLKRSPRTVLECMRNKSASMLAVLLGKVTSGFSRGYYPKFDSEFLPKNPRLSIIDGEFDPVDALIGSNNGDGATLITKSMKSVFGFFGEKNPQINLTFGEAIIRNKFKSYPNQDRVVEWYLGDLPENEYDEIRFRVFAAPGDYSRICPSVYFADSFAKKNVNVYYYSFTHRPSNSPWAPWMLSVHFDETPFVFGYPLRYPEKYTAAEHDLSRRLIRAWACFAKTGNPGVESWLPYSKENPVYQVLDTISVKTGNGVRLQNCNFFRSYFGF